MSANSKLQLTGLDFDNIKNNLKDYLRGQSQFSDFDFEGAGINILLDLLAYNTHYLGFYMNMVANEMFLDTAVLRPSIVSHVKTLGYTPRSSTAALATVNVTISKANSDPTTLLTMPRFTAFASEALNGVSFNFVSVESHVASNSNNNFTFSNVVLKEGNPVSKSFIVENQINPQQYFDLSDPNIDTSTLEVVVQVSQTNQSQNTFTLAEDATTVNGFSNVYYLEEGQSGNYKIYFGDGILGKKLSDGNIVTVSYIQTNGEDANGLRIFRLQSSMLSGSTSNVSVVIPSTSGSPPETAESVKFTAPKSYISQNRAVTENDYINIINEDYPYFDSVNVWGGEKNDPPVYGKVFISAKPRSGFAITEAEKLFVRQQVLQPVGVLTVIPEFVDADYNYLNFRVTAYYNPRLTSLTAGQINTIINNAIIAWSDSNLNTFNNSFRVSKLQRSIDDADSSILNSSVKVFIEKRFDPDLDQAQTYTLTFGCPLNKGLGKNRLYSSPSFTQEDSTGVERQCYIEETPESTTGIESVAVLNPGRGYTQNPTLVIVGDGQGANAYAKIVNGQIESVVVDAEGSNYTTATITVQGGNGSGGQLEAVIQGSRGTLRSYYFDQSNNKIVLDSTVGSINYVDGIIKLQEFAPANVANPTKTLSLHIQPENDDFSTSLNRILTFDSSDPGAVSISLKTGI